MHVAAYSERKGTFAFRQIQDDVPINIKRERLNEVNKLQDKIQNDLNSKYLGNDYEVLIEGKNREKFYGRTEGDKLVYVENLSEDFLGEIVKTKIIAKEKTGDDLLVLFSSNYYKYNCHSCTGVLSAVLFSNSGAEWGIKNIENLNS